MSVDNNLYNAIQLEVETTCERVGDTGFFDIIVKRYMVTKDGSFRHFLDGTVYRIIGNLARQLLVEQSNLLAHQAAFIQSQLPQNKE